MSTNSPAGRVAIARLDSASPDFDARLRALLHYEASQDAAIEKIVAESVATRARARCVVRPFMVPSGRQSGRHSRTGASSSRAIAKLARSWSPGAGRHSGGVTRNSEVSAK